MYRPQIKVLDCTIRDGGLMNNSHFTMETVQNVYRALCEAGVDVIELGYRNSRKMFSPSKYGIWRFCDEEVLKRAIDGVETTAKIAVMQDAHKAFSDDLLPKEKSVVDIVRVATYVKDVDKAINLANNAMDLGYQVAINIMSVSQVLEKDLDEALQQIEEETKVYAVGIVDSFGNLYSEDIDYLVKKFRSYLKTKDLGIHCHNNQQLAYANTIQAIINNVNHLDGTLYGLGRAAGNCPLELLLGFLKNPKYLVRPLLDVIGKEIMPMTKEMTWGYTIPYMVTGMLNLHPDAGLEMLALPESDPERTNYAEFYDRQTRLAD